METQKLNVSLMTNVKLIGGGQDKTKKKHT